MQDMLLSAVYIFLSFVYTVMCTRIYEETASRYGWQLQILNKQSRTANKVWSSSSGAGRLAKVSSPWYISILRNATQGLDQVKGNWRAGVNMVMDLWAP
jgi:hypothetical protein